MGLERKTSVLCDEDKHAPFCKGTFPVWPSRGELRWSKCQCPCHWKDGEAEAIERALSGELDDN
jgi:hypothetical protein